jgi:three-Cys-motif partner protein
MKNADTKIVMLEHSKAKVELYSRYLSRFLNILSRNPFVKKIFLFDLMCGEGKYLDGSAGSPIEALVKIKDHYYSNNKSCPEIEIWFNDKDKSFIESDKLKIERVKALSSKIFCPPNVHVQYFDKDFQDIFPKVVDVLANLKNEEKALLFIDPYGYKEVSPINIKSLLLNKNSELLLFLPISFMYRFAEKSISSDMFAGGEPLQKFILDLFGVNSVKFNSKYDFLTQLSSAFRDYLKNESVFVSTFTIERDKQNIYSLFFFTHHIKGFEAMLEAKWELDEQSGRGFKLDAHPNLFSEVEISNFPQKLEKFISEHERTNIEIYNFGLYNEFLPKHTNMIFSEWQKSNPYFKVNLLDGSVARKGAFYLKEKEQKVIFRIEK